MDGGYTRKLEDEQPASTDGQCKIVHGTHTHSFIYIYLYCLLNFAAGTHCMFTCGCCRFRYEALNSNRIINVLFIVQEYQQTHGQSEDYST